MRADRPESHAPWAAVTAACVLALSAGSAGAAATIVINNINAPGVGFNDPTPAEPVGGNAGTTLGAQRLLAFQRAADVWGATLTSSARIIVNAQFSNLTCTATSAVLGSAGPTSSLRNFTGAPFADTWYPVALRNKLVGSEANLNQGQISANFNARLGQPDCLPDRPFYLGLDNNAGNAINLVTVLLHEFGHGLGFTVGPTNGQTGTRSGGSPSVWERFMFDNAQNKSWFDMTNSERAASAIGVDKLAWSGANVTAGVPSVLRSGQPSASISGVAAGAAAGPLTIGEATLGTPLSTSGFTGEVMPVVDQPDAATGLACTPLSSLNRLAVRGKIALVDRGGTCNFAVKAKNAQDAGAVGLLVANNAPGLVPLGGVDPTVTLTAAFISQADGVRLKTVLRKRSRTASGVFATLGLAGTQFSGADALGRALLYAPNPYEGGSSVSHFDRTATRNLLMEPAINADLTQSVRPPEDLTFPLFQDIGW